MIPGLEQAERRRTWAFSPRAQTGGDTEPFKGAFLAKFWKIVQQNKQQWQHVIKLRILKIDESIVTWKEKKNSELFSPNF